jgi:L-threonate 2-dehydrogenase
MTDRSIGIIGLGIMGGAIAASLRRADFHVTGYDTDAARGQEAAALGVEIAADAAAVARASRHILVSLPSETALEATVKAIVSAAAPQRIVAELSTFTLEGKQRAHEALRAAGHTLLDCPLSGTGAQAKVRDLVVFASGDSAAIQTLRPAFDGFARETHDLGAFGNGSKMKYVANLLVAIHNVAAAEALVLAARAGLDPELVLKAVGGGAGSSRMFQVRGPMMAARRYEEPTMRVATWQKDLDIISAYARAVGSPIPLMAATLPIYAAALVQGHGEHDTAAVHAVLEKMAGGPG